jgi:exodeoxyribonuclease III
MRVATWNVNSLGARLDKVLWWLERAAPDVLLMQETKLSDDSAPAMAFRMAGYELVHHGEGRWNGVAIASRSACDDVLANFGDPLRTESTPDLPDDQPLAEARMVRAVCSGLTVVSVYAPNGRIVGSPFYAAKLAWYDRLSRWLGTQDPTAPLLIGGDFNVAPTDLDVWDPGLAHGGTHVSGPERAAFQRLLDWGLVDAYRLQHGEPERYSWWDYRAGNFQRNEGMRIDHLLVTRPIAERVVAAEIDREARKGVPTPSDHAPVFVDLDSPGSAIDPGWSGVDERIAERRRLNSQRAARAA